MHAQDFVSSYRCRGGDRPSGRLLLAGGASEARLYPELTQAVIADWPTNADALEQSAEMLGLERMTLVAENGGAALYYHETTGELAVRTADGGVWYSNPQNRLEFDLLSQGRYTSLLYANVITANESEKTMYSYDDCVQYGQTKTSRLDNGLRVEYLFGRTARQGAGIRRRSPRNGIMKSRRSFPRMRSCISAATIAWRIPRRSRISRCWPHSRKPIQNLSSSGGSTCSRATRRYWKLTGCLRILRRSGIPRRIGTGITD